MPTEVVARSRLGLAAGLCVAASAVVPGCFLTAFPAFRGMLGGVPVHYAFGRPTIEALPIATGAGAVRWA